eukprot:Skav233280  [mRNA]  locus=scaffold114:58816:62674:+ [translate_table: standard]
MYRWRSFSLPRLWTLRLEGSASGSRAELPATFAAPEEEHSAGPGAPDRGVAPPRSGCRSLRRPLRRPRLWTLHFEGSASRSRAELPAIAAIAPKEEHSAGPGAPHRGVVFPRSGRGTEAQWIAIRTTVQRQYHGVMHRGRSDMVADPFSVRRGVCKRLVCLSQNLKGTLSGMEVDHGVPTEPMPLFFDPNVCASSQVRWFATRERALETTAAVEEPGGVARTELPGAQLERCAATVARPAAVTGDFRGGELRHHMAPLMINEAE